jgi:membrane protein
LTDTTGEPASSSRLARLIGTASAAGSRYFAAGCPQHAAGIAYRVLFSLAPLAIVLVSVFGLVLQDDDVRASVVDRIVDVLPVDASGRADVEEAIEAIATPTSAAGLVSLLVFFWAASGMMGAIRRGLEAAMDVAQGRPIVRSKLVDFALVGATALLVLVSIALGLVVDLTDELVAELAAAVGTEGAIVEQAIGLGLPFLLWVATALVVYRFVPAAGLRVSDALAGAIVTALLLLGISLAGDVVDAKTADWSVIYGSLTSLLVFLYSVYLYASALLFGAAVAAEWSRPHRRQHEPLRVRARQGVRSLFVRRSSETSGRPEKPLDP